MEGREGRGNEPGVLPEVIVLVVVAAVMEILFGIVRERKNAGTPPTLYGEEKAE